MPGPHSNQSCPRTHDAKILETGKSELSARGRDNCQTRQNLWGKIDTLTGCHTFPRQECELSPTGGIEFYGRHSLAQARNMAAGQKSLQNLFVSQSGAKIGEQRALYERDFPRLQYKTHPDERLATRQRSPYIGDKCTGQGTAIKTNHERALCHSAATLHTYSTQIHAVIHNNSTKQINMAKDDMTH